MLETTEFDVAEYLNTEELRQGYLELVARDGTKEELQRAINDAARAREMAKTAEAKAQRCAYIKTCFAEEQKKKRIDKIINTL